MWTPRRWILVVLVCAVGLAAGSVNGYTAGSRLRRTLVRGKVTAIESGELIGEARVQIKGVSGSAEVTSNQRGRYRIRLPAGVEGTFEVVIRADGRWTRRSWVQVEAAARRLRADWNLIPKDGKDFDMDLFNAVTRFPGFGTTRWETPPKFRILNTKIECLDSHLATMCSQWVATSSPLTISAQTRLNAIANARALTGGFIAEPEVEIVTLAPGTRIAADDLFAPGVFTLGEAIPGQFGDELPLLPAGKVIRTRVMLSNPELGSGNPWTFARRLARGLGYVDSFQSTELCEQVLARGSRSLLCSMHGTIQATEFDRVMGAVLYGRAVGTTSPDSEPPPS